MGDEEGEGGGEAEVAQFRTLQLGSKGFAVVLQEDYSPFPADVPDCVQISGKAQGVGYEEGFQGVVFEASLKFLGLDVQCFPGAVQGHRDHAQLYYGHGVGGPGDGGETYKVFVFQFSHVFKGLE